MKSDLLRVICGMVFVVFMQSNVEGMDIKQPVIGEQAIKKEFMELAAAATVPELINKATICKTFGKGLHLLRMLLVECFELNRIGGYIRISPEDLELMKEIISNFADSYEEVKNRYPHIFSKDESSIYWLFQTKYKIDEYSDIGRLIIDKKYRRNISHEYSQMINDGVNWSYFDYHDLNRANNFYFIY